MRYVILFLRYYFFGLIFPHNFMKKLSRKTVSKNGRFWGYHYINKGQVLPTYPLDAYFNILFHKKHAIIYPYLLEWVKKINYIHLLS